MATICQGLVTALASVGLWIAGTIVFDAVHWALHRMAASSSPLLRALAWPHSVHHRWLDAELRIHWEEQGRNAVCHLLLEYLTQLAFTAGLALWLPLAPVLGCAGLQTAVFVYLLSQRGLDPNHRPIEMLDAAPPSWLCPPAYHALHHVHPDAHFSAYTRLVDWAVGGGAMLAGRRYAVAGARTPLGRALADALGAAGARSVEPVSVPEDVARDDLDVVVLCAQEPREVAWVERFVAATRHRKLPPEVWSVHTTPDDPTARHYFRDVRVCHRTLLVPDVEALGDAEARRAARALLFWIRRGACFAPARFWQGLASFRRFRRTRPARPPEAPRVRSRAEARALAARGPLRA